MNILRTKTVEQSIAETEEGEHKLKRELSALDLIVFGIGIIIGTGIFVLTGIAAATSAGPAIVLSFVVAGVVCALATLCYAEFASSVIQELAELVNIGTLLAFVLVSLGIIGLRRKNPDLKRTFSVPFVPVLPIVSALACIYLMISLPLITWIRFVIWLVIGVVVYFTYSVHKSRLAHQQNEQANVSTADAS